MACQLRTEGIIMKRSLTLALFMALASCSSNSSPGSNNVSPSSTVTGADYLPASDNTTLTAHVNGAVTHVDINGRLTSRDEYDQDWKLGIGSIQTHKGQSVRPIFGFDASGNPTIGGNPVGYGGSLNSEVFGMNRFDPDKATILPKTITVGQSWTPAFVLPIQCQAKAVQHFAQFTATDGTSYSDVIQVFVSYFDSSFQANTSFADTSIIKYAANADLYFANGVGLVEADVHNYEHLYAYIYYGRVQVGKHEYASGNIWRKN